MRSKIYRVKKSEWKNAKHAQQWENTIQEYVNPKIGDHPIKSITTSDVLDCLKPIWTIKTETASRIRSRIENIIGYGIAHGYREGPNPAQWRGHLDKLLPSPKKIVRPTHQPALSIDKAPSFYFELQSSAAISARALQILMLTATRSSETLLAKWSEFNDDIWTIPAERMKAGKEHRVPLAPTALEILDALKTIGGEYVFTNNQGKPLSNMAMLQLMRRNGYGSNGEKGNAVPHGFRSTFRDWSSEYTNYPRDACEMALAHTISDKTEAAYRRGDMLQIRRKMMDDWAKFLTSKII